MPTLTSYHDTRDVRAVPTITGSTNGYRYIGKNTERERVYIQIELRHQPAQITTTGTPIQRETVDHRIVSAYQELSICGELRYEHEDRGGGQCIDELDRMDPDTLTIAPEELSQLRTLWESSHLNGLNAACIHQDARAHINPATGQWFEREDWDRMRQEQTAKCPHGYAYGSKWLVRALTNDELRTARRLIATLQNQPESPATS